jgi:hypothetical protein
MSLYPDAIRDLTQAFEQYRQRAINEEKLQQHLMTAANTISAREERELGDVLRQADAEIELLRFTVNHEQLYERVVSVVSELERRSKT